MTDKQNRFNSDMFAGANWNAPPPEDTVLLALLNRAEQGGDDLEEDLNLILRELPRSGDDDPKIKPSPFRDRKKL